MNIITDKYLSVIAFLQVLKLKYEKSWQHVYLALFYVLCNTVILIT